MEPLRNKKRKEQVDVETSLKLKQHRSEVDWGYGIGREGFRDAPGTSGKIKVVVIDGSFPWWVSALLSVDITVTKVWLRINPSVGLHKLSTSWCGKASVDTGPNHSESLWDALTMCDWLVVGGKVPIELVDRGMWRLSNLKIVVATDRSKEIPPQPWTIKQWRIRHWDTGGVTDGVFNVTVAAVSRKLLAGLRATVDPAPGQDLRWIMKTNEGGRFVEEGGERPGHLAILKVSYCARGVLRQAGLLPYQRLDSTVRASYRGQHWVDRKLTAKEVLLALDAPERLGIEITSEDLHSELIRSIQLPGKILQWMVQELARVYRVRINERTTQKRKAPPTMASSGRSEKRARLSSATEQDLPGVTIRMDVMEQCVLAMETHNRVATKNDNSEVMVSLWDENLKKGVKGVSGLEDYERAVKVIRGMLLRIWWRNVGRSFRRWVKECSRPVECIDAGRDCIRRACGATWWHWDAGSRPFFWRWPDDYQHDVRVGVKPWFLKPVEQWRRAQRDPECNKRRELIKGKLEVIRDKGYIESGRIRSLMPFFDVPKGLDDIRMVYDGSASGLNACMWAPWFPLPTAQNLVRSVEPGTWMADNDIGEMFHNFMLHDHIREHCGLDISLFFPRVVKGKELCVWERWNRLAMGLRNSPYCAVQGMLIAQEVIEGDRMNDENVFRWETIVTNLPGSPLYDPSKSWFSKVRKDGTIAADLFIYVDDIRSSAATQTEAWRASQRISSVLGFLGLQDAARKRRSPSQEAGAWTGSVVWTTNDEVSTLTTKEKWDKAKDHLQWIQTHISDEKGLDNKKLQSIRGFLVYVARTYGSMKPYLKGIHATIDSWRTGRDVDGWKVRPDPELQWEIDEKIGHVEIEKKEPAWVRPVPRLRNDLRCLLRLTDAEEPPKQRVRMSKHARVVYGFGDASKQGFGASIELPDKKIYWRYGQWTPEEAAKEKSESGLVNMVIERSSNFRELRNLVESVESAVSKGLLDNCELFMFTDNSTAEAAYNKGTSSSESLFELVLRLRMLEMSGSCTIHLVHIAGTRMIWQGTDGLSRGDQNAGVMSGETMLSFVPLHQSARCRSKLVQPWVESWAQKGEVKEEKLTVLEVEDWATPIKVPGTYLWYPPPALADVAAEFMANAVHKRPRHTHIFVCPRLMCSRWYKFLMKASDVIFRIPIGCSIWGIEQHEPLILAIVFPLSRTEPWKQGKSSHVQHSSTIVQDLLSRDLEGAGFELRKLLVWTRTVGAV